MATTPWWNRNSLRALWGRRRRLIISAGGGLVLAAVLSPLEFQYFEAAVYDAMISRSQPTRTNENFAIIKIDEQTQEDLGEFAPLSIQRHTELLDRLSSYRPRAVGYLPHMIYVSQEDPEAFAGAGGEAFVSAARRLEESRIPFLIGTPFDVNGEVLPPFPVNSLRHAVAVIHKDGNIFGRDHVTRRALVSIYSRGSFHLELAIRAGLIHGLQDIRGVSGAPNEDGRFVLFQYSRPPIPEYSFSDVLSGKVSTQDLAGKILLVGTQIKKNPGDFSRTPLTRVGDPESKLQIHAQILEAFAEQQTLISPPEWLSLLLTFLVATLVFWSVMSLTPLEGVLTTAAFATLIMAIAWVLFRGILGLPGVSLPLAKILVALFLSYYVIVPFRLIREYRTRWTFQRENEVLVQVEKLKTNFLNLVTHDLKTPVARIQGLAEQTLRQGDAELSQDNLHRIMDSTEELNRFITSILDISKAETAALEPNMESRDVNVLLEQCLSGFEPQALEKAIRFVTDFEPLFPISLDPTLMTKVFNNLIDNALKYSPAGRTITLRTREEGQSVEIRIQDEGIGLSPEEKDKVFTRFFRARHSHSDSVPGTGLGLYLAKYFIEAHQGSISVESTLGCGSTFIVRLPLSSPGVLFKGLTTSLTSQSPRKFSSPLEENSHA